MKFRLSLAAAIAASAAFAEIKVEIKADRPDCRYRAGETVEYVVTVKDGWKLCEAGLVEAKLDNFGAKTVSCVTNDLAKGNPFRVKGSLGEPGVLRLTASVLGDVRKETAWSTDVGGNVERATRVVAARTWGVMVDPEKIVKGSPRPADFDEFWDGAIAKCEREVPLDPEVRLVPGRCTPDFDFYRVSFATVRNRRVYGYLSIPRDRSKAPFPVLVSVPGAGCGGWMNDMAGSADEIRMTITVHDFEPPFDLGEMRVKYDALNREVKEKWNVGYYAQSGLWKDREDCFFYPVIIGVNRAFNWLAARTDVDRTRFHYNGTSQGGGFGIIMSALNRNITKACINVPAMTDTMGYLKGRQSGWPRPVENQTAEHRARAAEIAPYYDAANFARRIRAKVRFCVGLTDTTCAPCAVWAGYNEIPGEKRIYPVPGMGHSVNGGVYAKMDAWLKASGRDSRALEMTATPESQGISSVTVLDWIEAMERELKYVHGFTLARHGKVIAEGWWKPFSKERPHMMYSHSKGFTSTAIGFLVDEGKLDLDELVVDVFPEAVPAKISKNLAHLRVRDLLTMNVGKQDHLLRNQDGDWVREFFAKDFEKQPGLSFRYDSDATYLLSAIVAKRGGAPLLEYLKPRFLDPLGMRGYWTSTSPQGIPCGGWGTHFRTSDIARYAQFYLDGGKWNGEQLLSKEWCDLAVACHSRSGWGGETDFADGDWHRGYGFQFWRCRHNAYRSDGADGQYSIMIPEKDAVVSIHAALGDMGLEQELVWRYLLPAFRDRPLEESSAACGRLRRKCAALSLPCPAGVKEVKNSVLGRTFKAGGNKRGFRSFALEAADGGWKCAVETATGRYEIPVGFNEWKEGELRFEPERADGKLVEGLGGMPGRQPVAASGAFAADGVFHLTVHFLDYTSRLELDFTPDGVKGIMHGMTGTAFE